MAILAAGISMMQSALAQHQVNPTETKLFDGLARELLSDIARMVESPPARTQTEAAINYFKKPYAYAAGPKLRLAIWPFREDRLPLPKEIADQFNVALLASLIDRSAGRYEFVAREALRNVIRDLQDTGGLDAGGSDPIALLMENARRVDILIQGRLRLDGGDIILSYKAVRMDGAIVGQTGAARIPLHGRPSTPLNLRSLDRAIEQAANKLSAGAPDLTELHLGGIRFQTSGVQPAFGQFVQAKLATALEARYANDLSGRRITVVEPRMNRSHRGAPVDRQALNAANFAPKYTVYLLSGDYWVLNNAIELRLRLRNRRRATVTWSGKLRPDAAAGLALEPRSDFEALRDNDGLGPFRFNLTSERGRDPVYRLQERLNLILRTEEEAWVYCFYRQANGKVIQIFPNPYYWTRHKEPRLAARVAHTMPSPELFPFDLRIRPPLGLELVKCFAVSRDVTAELPPELRGRSLTPLPEKLVLRLAEVFRSLPHTAITEASLALTIIKP